MRGCACTTHIGPRARGGMMYRFRSAKTALTASAGGKSCQRRPLLETLERRSMLAATISGAVMRDITGNGLTGDDTPLAGVTVRLYNDVNGNGVLDGADGSSISSKTTAADGSYAFTGLSQGKYLVRDVPGSNQVRTFPFLSDTIAVNVDKQNGTFDGNNFANYVKDFNPGDISGISFTINGNT